MYLNYKTEYSFGSVYGPIKKVAKRASELGKYAGIADIDGTWGHVQWAKACKEADIKPIFGVVLTVVDGVALKERSAARDAVTFIAMNSSGLEELYALVDTAHKQFYYWPRITYGQLNEVSLDITILAGNAPQVCEYKREVFQKISPATPRALLGQTFLHPVACIDNDFLTTTDRTIYEAFADERKTEKKTTLQHILTGREWAAEFQNNLAEDALYNLEIIAANANVELPSAPMVKYPKKVDLKKLCEREAKKRNVDLTDPIYKARFEREIELIQDKGYVDYFLVVADVIKYAKKHMVVGPARGSSAGSLVCYIMGITEVDPIPFGLYFERFIDVNRFDLPDIDVDFQDNKRHLVINYLKRKYGAENVAQIGNISRLQAKSAINRFAKSFSIPLDEVEEVKDAIIERSGGDARAAFCMEDTFNDTDVGQKFIEKYPIMETVAAVEQHAAHTSIHAAGILVCNEPITKYAGINSRDNKRIAMIDKKDTEALNLLKIDALGLRTLTIFAKVCDAIGKKYEWLYTIPLDDPKAYKVFNDQRLTGIFQFEGSATQSLTRQMPVESMEDISALVAIARPGPLVSGGATSYIKYRTGKEKVQYMTDHPIIKEATEATYGIIIYQEQILHLGREYGGLSWEDTSDLRKAMSKSLGEEFFDQHKIKFIAGAIEKGESEEDAEKVWKNINTFGSWGMNKSHTISYSLISYLCAYLKAHYPAEFAVACLNNAKDDLTALKLLRDLHETEELQYVPFDPELSGLNWSMRDDVLYGGLTTLHGIGPAKAKEIIRLRKTKKTFPPGIQKALDKGDTIFSHLYPATELYGDYYSDPKQFGVVGGVTTIEDIGDSGTVTYIGRLINRSVRDANESILVTKRGGEYLDGPTTYINVTLEDDTAQIIGAINRESYERLGREIAETGKINKDWYMVYGQVNRNWRMIQIKNIRRITR